MFAGNTQHLSHWMRSPLLITVLAAGPVFVFPNDQGLAQGEPSGSTSKSTAESPEAKLPLHFGVSPRLDEVQPEPKATFPGTDKEVPSTREIENLPVPLPQRLENLFPPPPEGLTPTTIPLSATILSRFDGVRQGVNYHPLHGLAPPDANGAVSSSWYFQWVNTVFTKIDKQTGEMVIKPTNGNVIWTGLPDSNCAKHNNGDPIVLYDKAAGRWLLAQFAINEGGPYSECIALSETDDPTGRYDLFEYDFTQFNDYPKFGIWRDGYYVSFNMFTPNPGADYEWAGAKVCVFERDKMLATTPEVRKTARMKCLEPKDEKGQLVGGVLPADIDGTRVPPEGSPEYVLGFGVDQLLLWRINVNWTDIDQSTISTPTLITVNPFQPASCDSPRNACVPQTATTDRLESLPDRLMYRLSYRNFGNREALFATHTVKAGNGFGIRWYELSKDLSGMPQNEFGVRQQQTFAPDDKYRWIGSIASDKMGNMLVTYNVSDGNSHPSLRFTGRRANDPPNVLSAEGVIAEGKRSIGGSENGEDRWGDYGSISLDPQDDCTFWATGQYVGGGPLVGSSALAVQSHDSAGQAKPTPVLESSSLAGDVVSMFNWDTVVVSLAFPDCK